MIGQCGPTVQRILGADVIEVGRLFDRAHWRRGYAVEAAAACVDHAFTVLGADRVYAQVRDTDLPSMNVAIRLGMTVRGRFVKHYRGVDMPHLAFAVDRGDAPGVPSVPKGTASALQGAHDPALQDARGPALQGAHQNRGRILGPPGCAVPP